MVEINIKFNLNDLSKDEIGKLIKFLSILREEIAEVTSSKNDKNSLDLSGFSSIFSNSIENKEKPKQDKSDIEIIY